MAAMHRRTLLKSLAYLPLMASAPRLFATPAQSSKFLLVFLRGGYDAANLLVPSSSSFYYEARPNIAIAKPGTSPRAALAIDSDWSLHPALQDSVYRLFQSQQAAFVPFAGTDDLSRSHFETQDSIELGQPISGHRNYQSGFMNRLGSVLSGREAISFTDQLPLIFRGDLQVPNQSLRQVAKPAIDTRQSQVIASMYQHSPLAATVTEGFEIRAQVAQEMAAEMDSASRNAVSAKGFELEAVRIAKLMRDRYSLGFLDVGGWDTHVGEGGAEGYLANRFDELGRGLAAFAAEMGPRWDDTVVVVMSEFGRTFRENGNRGTDHGHGSVFWVLGGKLHGGRVAGEQVAVNASTLFQNRDFPVLNDYRAVLGGLFSRLYGLNGAQLATIFPGSRAVDLGLL
jgi:uncharacterized protein (DUF1501 family)